MRERKEKGRVKEERRGNLGRWRGGRKEGGRITNNLHFLWAYLVSQGHETLWNLELMVTQWVRVHDGSMFMVGNTQFLYQEVLASFPGQKEPGNEARKVC